MIVVKKNILILTGIFMVIVLSLVAALSIAESSYNSKPKSLITVVIDAGHGGVDGGALGYTDGVRESDLNLEIALKLKKYFLTSDIGVVMTRSDKNGLYGSATDGFKKRDMLKRKEIITETQPDLVISIHLNKYSTHSRRGAQVFFKNTSEEGILAANRIQTELNRNINTWREYEALKGDYYILNCTDFPSVIVECGFISNPEEAKLLTTAEYQDKLAYNIFAGTVSYFTESTKLAGIVM